MRAAVERIASDYAADLPVASLAARCNLSEPQFRVVFHEATGLSPLDYIANFRMKMAAALLRDGGRKIIEIALACGYPTLSSFNRRFQAHFQCSPRAYRKSLAVLTGHGRCV